ncbi:LLM class flavin-dependent oxidoreductase [Pseudonocardia sp. WMMC193]|uniref:LLM class flavin-dependent oxidoreductase n=1 Tax=Pseudonocardia sp. WMMC193 TaxID=2911965 RepID=UPI001F1E3717|nr:LLM class flavin-dependent oxidoreductase [Pseudonocardia sp. WMMC193]MCF7550832.1 LLM class flavin-dependent oxidoreductase [Pseudonocardia sp. WMMC193]
MTGSRRVPVGVGLPAAVPGTSPGTILECARLAEAAGLSSLAALDRVAYASHEPLLTLAAAAAVTERIGLAAHVVLGATREPALLAKQAATLHSLAGGRFVLGLGVGTRPGDYTATGTSFADRGRRLDAVIGGLRSSWAGTGSAGEVGPGSAGAPLIVVGGGSARAVERAARRGDGWIAGSVRGFAEGASEVREAWRRHGRDGAPRLLASGYVALGADGPECARRYLASYYAVTGQAALDLAATALTSASGVRDAVAELAEAGCDELVLYPCGPDPGQVELLADALR